MTRLAAVLLVLAACAGTPSPAQSPAAPPAPALADAQARASAAHQPLIAEFGAPWCKPCHAFAEHVLTEPRVIEALRGVTFVQYDIETTVGKAAAETCHVAGVPAVVGVTADGSVHPMASGEEPTADELIAFVTAAKAALAPR